MKKNYIAPETKIINIELQQMISTSPTFSVGNTSGDIESDVKEELDLDIFGDWKF